MPIEQIEELITHKRYDINTCNLMSIKCLNFVTVRSKKFLCSVPFDYYFSQK